MGYGPWINQNKPHLTFNYLREKYKSSIFGIYLGSRAAIVVTGWKAISESLLNEDLNGRPDVVLNRDRNDGENLGIYWYTVNPSTTRLNFQYFFAFKRSFGYYNRKEVLTSWSCGLELSRTVEQSS